MKVKLRRVVSEVDVRAGLADLPLLSVSIHRGVVLRNELTDDLPRADDLANYKVCREGDIVVNRMRAFQGAAGVTSRDGVVSPDYLVLRSKDLDPRFLGHLLRSDWMIGEMAARIRGIGSVELGAVRTPRINASDLLDIAINAPPRSEQRRIADFLDDEVARIDKIIAARKAQLGLVSSELDAVWDEAAMRFRVLVSLRRFLVSITDGPFGSSLTSAHYVERGTRVVRLGNIGLAEFRDDDRAYISEPYAKQLAQHAVRVGDVLMAGLGDERWPLGRAVVAPADLGPAIVKADCYRLRFSQHLSSEFAAWYLSSPPARRRFAELARGSTRARLNTQLAREALVPDAAQAAQDEALIAFAAARSVAVRRTAALTRSVALLAELKRSLITAAITGQFDVSSANGSRVRVEV